MTRPIVIRPARDGDSAFVAGLAGALLEFGSPAWEDPAAFEPGFRAVLAEAVRDRDGHAVLIAEHPDGTPLGFISLRRTEHIGGVPRVHVADLAVVEAERGGGVGRAPSGDPPVAGRSRGADGGHGDPSRQASRRGHPRGR